MTCLGGSEISINPGYWRNSTNSTKIYPCLEDTACLGGLTSECDTPYKGKYCSECKGIVDGKIYARVSGYKCAECSPLHQQILLVMIIHFGRVLVILYVLYNLLQNPKRNKPQTVLIRIITSYFQVISIVKEFELQWPEMVQKFLNMLSQIASVQDSFYSFDCVLYQIGFTRLSTYYTSVAIVGVTPVVIMILSIPVWIVASWCKTKKER